MIIRVYGQGSGTASNTQCQSVTPTRLTTSKPYLVAKTIFFRDQSVQNIPKYFDHFMHTHLKYSSIVQILYFCVIDMRVTFVLAMLLQL